MGSGVDEHPDKSHPLGIWLAQLGVHLLTGGGGGVMTAVARSFASVTGRKGLSIGILPAMPDAGSGPVGYPNPWVDVPIETHLAAKGDLGESRDSRNHINILTATVVIALPGSSGTASEVRLAVDYERPVIAFVDERHDIPGLIQLPSVKSANTLADVQEFVVSQIS